MGELRDRIAAVPTLAGHLPGPGAVLLISSMAGEPMMVATAPRHRGAELATHLAGFFEQKADRVLALAVIDRLADAEELNDTISVLKAITDEQDRLGLPIAVDAAVCDGFGRLNHFATVDRLRAGLAWADQPSCIRARDWRRSPVLSRAINDGALSPPGSAMSTGRWAPAPDKHVLHPATPDDGGLDMLDHEQRAVFVAMLTALAERVGDSTAPETLAPDHELVLLCRTAAAHQPEFVTLLLHEHNRAVAAQMCAALAARVRGPHRSDLLGCGALVCLLLNERDQAAAALLAAADLETAAGRRGVGELVHMRLTEQIDDDELHATIAKLGIDGPDRQEQPHQTQNERAPR